MLDQVCRAYPEARGRSRRASRARRRSTSVSGRLAEASHTYKRLLEHCSGRRSAVRWRSGGWRTSYEARQALRSRRGTVTSNCWRGFPSKPWIDRPRAGRSAELAAAELARPPSLDCRRASGAADADAVVPPMALAAARDSQPTQGVLALRASPRRWTAGRVFLVEKAGLRLLDPMTGGRRDGRVDLGAPAVWAGYLADKLIVATSRQIAALELSQGTVQWRYDAVARRARTRDRPDPFADAEPTETPRRRRPPGASCRVSSS